MRPAVDSREDTVDLAVFRRQDRVERGGEEREVVMLRGRGEVGGEGCQHLLVQVPVAQQIRSAFGLLSPHRQHPRARVEKVHRVDTPEEKERLSLFSTLKGTAY